MATLVASTSPSRPMSAMYAQETGRIQGLPHGAADTVPHGCSRRSGTTGWSGRKGARWGATQIGPIPGPPPPCGMQNVLWRFRWHTSAPMSAGRQRPTLAVLVAASLDTRPPWAWAVSANRRVDPSETAVLGGDGTI